MAEINRELSKKAMITYRNKLIDKGQRKAMYSQSAHNRYNHFYRKSLCLYTGICQL